MSSNTDFVAPIVCRGCGTLIAEMHPSSKERADFYMGVVAFCPRCASRVQGLSQGHSCERHTVPQPTNKRPNNTHLQSISKVDKSTLESELAKQKALDEQWRREDQALQQGGADVGSS